METPPEIYNKILLYSSTPTANIMRPVINKYYEVLSMRYKNKNCNTLSFYKMWLCAELDQVKIDRWARVFKECINDLQFCDF
jgi:hypothetical protein